MPFVEAGAWWIRVFDYPRVQVLVLAAAVAIAWLFVPGAKRRTRALWVGTMVLCGVTQALTIMRYTPMYPEQVHAAEAGEAGDDVSLLVSNVLMDNRDAGPLLQLIADNEPDIIAVVETDDWWQEQLKGLEQSHPHTVQAPLPNTYGMLVYSRLPLHDAEIEYLVSEDIPSMHGRVELRSGRMVDLHILHPKPPAPKEATDTDERDAELLIVAKHAKERTEPTIVAGDLNDVAWSSTTQLFQEISGLLDPRIGRGLYSTYHAQHWAMRWPLDHVFHSEEFFLVKLERLGDIGSDHFPMFSHLVLDPEAAGDQEEPQADAEDREEANEKIAEPESTEAENSEG